MAGFGDDDPEDAYDATDPALVRLGVLKLWVASIALEAARGDRDVPRVKARILSALTAAHLLHKSHLRHRHRRFLRLLRDWLDDLADEIGA